MLTVSNLTVKKNDQVLFENLGFSIFSTGILCIKGPNGSGKTSLLNCLSSLANPHAGEIFYNEINIQDALFEYRSLLSYIGHKSFVDENLTVMENLRFWAELKGSNIAIDAAVFLFGLEQFLDVESYKLSAGWNKRLMLAKLLLDDTDLWLLDEPFANLDQNFCENFTRIIQSKSNNGGIIIMTSHQDTEIAKQTLDLQDFKAQH